MFCHTLENFNSPTLLKVLAINYLTSSLELKNSKYTFVQQTSLMVSLFILILNHQ